MRIEELDAAFIAIVRSYEKHDELRRVVDVFICLGCGGSTIRRLTSVIIALLLFSVIFGI